MAKKILFFYPSNKRSVSLETLFRELKRRGYHVTLLSMCERGDLHNELEKYGIKTYANGFRKTNSLSFYLRQMIQLVSFCKKNRIDIVFSHLQMANLVSVIGRHLMRTKVIVFRHHDFSRTRNEAIGDTIINKLAKVIVVPSTGVKKLMLKNEKVTSNKLVLIPYMYNFTKYQSPDPHAVACLRSQFVQAEQTLLLIMVARLVPAKRHSLVFKAMDRMVGEGYDLQMLVLDEGPEESRLKKMVIELGLQDRIHFIGFTRQVTLYLAAADLFIHPSISEASNSAVKEAGLLQKAVVVCQDVGDFSDYIESERNGFLLSREHTASELYDVVKKVYQERKQLEEIGKNLRRTVLRKFSLSEDTLSKYDQLIGI